jgi:sugar O-acyltransferase (sialic acid O-acetyltransferase NeuD family)
MGAPRNVIVLGTAGNCVDVVDAMLCINEARGREVYRPVGFLDDDQSRWGMAVHGVPVLGGLQSAADHRDCWFVNGIGSTRNFHQKDVIIAKTGVPVDRFETIVHPTASVSRMATLGRGVVVLQHVAIASSVRIGDHVIILPNSTVSHDDVIGDYTCVAGGVCISGGVTVGRLCYLGSNCTIIGNTTIGDYSLIGMGSAVLHDVAPNSVMVGSPARVLRQTR